MDSTASLIAISIAVFIGYLFILLIILESLAGDYDKRKKELNKDYGTRTTGRWLASTYYFKHPVPIVEKTNDEQLQKIITKHNKIVKVFWLSLIIIMPLMFLIFNLIDEK